MNKIRTTIEAKPKLRVLLVPDSVFWITGRIAQQIAQYNPWIEPTICSHEVVRKLLREHGVFPGKIDVAHFLTPNIANDLIGCFREQAACVTTVHHYEEDQSIAAIPQADAAMTVCHQWHNHLIALGISADKLAMVPNGVQTELFCPGTDQQRMQLRAKYGISEDRFVIGFSAKRTSNTGNRKGIETLAAAMTAIQRRVPKATFVIIGPGWREFVAQQAPLGIQCVYLPFILDHNELAPIYRALDAYWVTARVEGGPVPLLEAMSSGVACITTRVGIALEIVNDHQNARFADFGDVDGFVSATEQLAKSPEMRRRIGDAARQTILDRCQSSKTASQARELYELAVTAFKKRAPTTTIRCVPDTDSFAGQNTLEATLESLPVRLRLDSVTEEHLIFIRHLRAMGASRAAFKLGLRALRLGPANREVWRSLLAMSYRASLHRVRKPAMAR